MKKLRRLVVGIDPTVANVSLVGQRISLLAAESGRASATRLRDDFRAWQSARRGIYTAADRAALDGFAERYNALVRMRATSPDTSDVWPLLAIGAAFWWWTRRGGR